MCKCIYNIRRLCAEKSEKVFSIKMTTKNLKKVACKDKSPLLYMFLYAYHLCTFKANGRVYSVVMVFVFQ